MRWPIVPLKRVASIRVSNVDKKAVDGEVPVRLCNYTDVYYRDTIHSKQEFMSATATPDQVVAFRLCSGDVVITKDSESPEDIGVPAYVGAGATDLVCGYHLALVRPTAGVLHARYLYWAMSSAGVRKQLSSAATGITRYGLRSDGIETTKIPLPEIRQQRLVADLLDAETAGIDTLIARRQRMTNLLKERWRSHLVELFQGREATLQILSEGIVSVRSGWTIRALVDLTDRSVPIVYGILLPGPCLWDGVPYLGAGDVVSGKLVLADLPRTTPEIAAQYPRSRVRAGELVYAIRGSVGAVQQLPYELDGINLSRDVARIRPSAEVNERWLLYALRSELAQEQFRKNTVGATITGVNIGDLKRVKICVPPRADQDRMAAAADASWHEYQRSLLLLHRQIDLLQERRTALVTAAVTGQLARGAVA